MKKFPYRSLVRLSAVLLIAFFVIYAGCKKKGAAPVVKTDSGPADLSGTLVTQVPANTTGFFQWDSTLPAYKRLMNSPWGGKGEFKLANIAADDSGKNVLAILKRAGLDFSKGETWRMVFSKAVFFTVPEIHDKHLPAGGLLYESAPEMNLGEKLLAAKKELQTAALAVNDEKVTVGQAFSFEIPEAAVEKPLPLPGPTDPAAGAATGQENADSAVIPQPAAAVPAPAATTPAAPRPRVYLGWKDRHGVIGSDLAVVESVLAGSSGGKLPAIVETAEFKKATAEYPTNDLRYGLGYFDLDGFLSALSVNLSGTELGDTSKNPIKTVSFALSMEQFPTNELRIVHQAKNEDQAKWLATLTSSPSSALLPALPANPLLFLSLDGKSVRNFTEQVLKKEQTEALKDDLIILNGVKRIGIAAQIAPLGQSILPIPDAMLTLEVENAADTYAKILARVNAWTQKTGMAGMDWKEKDVAGKKVNYILSPLGFGLFMAPVGNLVLATSSEAMMQTALTSLAGKDGQFAKNLPSAVSGVLDKEDSLANLYLNFEQVGAFMENLGGVLQMYAPQNQSAEQALAPENIENIKKMGMLLGYIKPEDKMIRIRSFYQPIVKQVASSK